MSRHDVAAEEGQARKMKRPDDLRYTGIEAVFRATKLATNDRFVQIDQAGLIKWSRLEEMELWQAVALHSFLDPDALGHNTEDALQYLFSISGPLKAWRQQGVELSALDLSKLGWLDNLQAGVDALKDKLRWRSWSGIEQQSRITVAEFHAWASRVELPVHGGWLARSAGTAERWSWGRHTTPLLDALEAAAKAHWRRVDEGGQYDPLDPTSASTNDKVASWLQDRFPSVANETAQVMARILRDPNLPAGRPRER